MHDKIKINDLSKLLLDGYATIKIFNNKFLTSSFEIKSNNKENISIYIDEFNYKLDNFFIKANIIEEQLGN